MKDIYHEEDDVFIEKQPIAPYNQTNFSVTVNSNEKVEKSVNENSFETGSKNDAIFTGLSESQPNLEDKHEEKREPIIDIINDGNVFASCNGIVENGQATVTTDTLNNELNMIEKMQYNIKWEHFMVYLERNAECERKCYRKILGSVEELYISLKREDLHKIRELYSIEEKSTKTNEKSRWRRWHSHQVKQFWCKGCSFATDHRYQLFSHIWEKHEDLAIEKRIPAIRNIAPDKDPRVVWYKCTDCAYMTKLKAVFQNHLIIHKSVEDVEKKFICASCSLITKRKKDLEKHIMSRHRRQCEITFHKCSYCNFRCRNPFYLKKHILMLHKADEVRKFKCKLCPFKTKYSRSFLNHKLTHKERRKLYKCSLCPFQTPHKSTLTASHFLSHKGDESRIYSCAQCPYKSKTKDTLRKHMLTHSSPARAVMYKCDLCPFETKHKCYLNEHRRNHQTDRPHACSFCPYKAKTVAGLRMHTLLHKDPSEGTIYKCDKCPYYSRNCANVKRHKVTHMSVEEIQFIQCEYCEYQAKTKNHLKAHFNNVHKDAKDVTWYKCDMCDAQFKHTGNLKRHKLSHFNNTKQFPCSECSLSFTAKSTFITHLMSIHKKVYYYYCDECKYKSRFISNIYKHKKNHK